ncbi:hypothetical protein CBM2600_B60254 [Cupriavidus taiwanensis]|nr:hypothetical protein CBM2600_B60254 [Cupriavidus taiwanensis]
MLPSPASGRGSTPAVIHEPVDWAGRFV